MDYRRFEDKEISEIGMGCYQLSGTYGPVKNKLYKKVLGYAVELGINFFDTADTYGPKAEELLGDVIGPVRDDIILQTKVGIKEGIKPNLSYDYIMSACEDSLERLNTSYIDYYLIHYADPKTPVEDTIAALKDLKIDGKIEGYGVSHIGIEEMKKYSRIGDMSVAMMELSAVSREASKEVLPFCYKNDIGAIAFSVTGRGILSGRYDKKTSLNGEGNKQIDPLFHHARFDSALRIVEKFRDIGKKYDKTPIQVGIKWILSQQGIICTLTGPSKKEHLEENIGGSGWELYKEDAEELEFFLKNEDFWLKEKEPQIIENILRNPLKKDTNKAFSDLIYVIETSIQHSLTTEKDILPTFQKLWSLKDSKGGIARENLKAIQKELRTILL
ncbi:MAG: aldo/keto reductase [Thermoplasmatota archaeon]